ncbi:MAG: hypothetical protein Q8934_21855 [Bacillota bacterium]|nr:hypothetical protein [Bacillota bacterium]
MIFNFDEWNKEKKESLTDGEEWAIIEDESHSVNEEDKTEFDLFGTALNEL